MYSDVQILGSLCIKGSEVVSVMFSPCPDWWYLPHNCSWYQQQCSPSVHFGCPHMPDSHSSGMSHAPIPQVPFWCWGSPEITIQANHENEENATTCWKIWETANMSSLNIVKSFSFTEHLSFSIQLTNCMIKAHPWAQGSHPARQRIYCY